MSRTRGQTLRPRLTQSEAPKRAFAHPALCRDDEKLHPWGKTEPEWDFLPPAQRRKDSCSGARQRREQNLLHPEKGHTGTSPNAEEEPKRALPRQSDVQGRLMASRQALLLPPSHTEPLKLKIPKLSMFFTTSHQPPMLPPCLSPQYVPNAS